MGPLDLILHLLNFLAPAWVVACLVALAAPIAVPRKTTGRSWWSQAALNFIAGSAVLAVGLWHYGVDGKMATYAALVVAVAACQWLTGRAWRG
jgi:hypothetical protein